eukprot:CAMPEP_0174710812 /NCGR_PEP_ID=MMETSP1094-20130205/12321_1 /TAXON_ID=156173 /ORGANISM="Chrysochromulina brevifilum, Strain UTEX LB 985" /LENGTH=204 /DNA_ID=CAMNT_0015909661 /DNA_START=189 /DNA_END=804 /DNA_ORIENTATION=-
MARFKLVAWRLKGLREALPKARRGREAIDEAGPAAHGRHHRREEDSTLRGCRLAGASAAPLDKPALLCGPVCIDSIPIEYLVSEYVELHLERHLGPSPGIKWKLDLDETPNGRRRHAEVENPMSSTVPSAQPDIDVAGAVWASATITVCDHTTLPPSSRTETVRLSLSNAATFDRMPNSSRHTGSASGNSTCHQIGEARPTVCE